VGHLKWKVPCVYIAENVQPNWPSCFAPPRTLSAAASPPPTTVCAVDDASGATGRLSCANGTGSAVFVTGGVGFFAASYIVAQLAQAPRAELAARA
jgi:tRNA A37 threonylcarbamoyladenosine dehydratase